MDNSKKIKPTKLDLAIFYLVMKLRNNLTRTKIIKLLYLADMESSKKFDSSITKVNYFRYLYGPFSKKILDAIDDLNGFEIVETLKEGYAGKHYYTYEIGRTLRFDVKKIFSSLKPDDQKKFNILREIVEKLGDKSTDEILEKVYQTKPFKNSAFGEEVELGVPQN